MVPFHDATGTAARRHPPEVQADGEQEDCRQLIIEAGTSMSPVTPTSPRRLQGGDGGRGVLAGEASSSVLDADFVAGGRVVGPGVDERDAERNGLAFQDDPAVAAVVAGDALPSWPSAAEEH